MSEKTIVISVAIIGLAMCVAVTWLWSSIPRKEKLKRIANREELTFDEIYVQFFAKKNLPKESVSELWNEVASSLELPIGKLRPSDRFDKELAPVKGWEYDDNIADVTWAAQDRIKKSGVQFDLSKIKTLGDYVEFFSSLDLQNKAVK